MRTEALTLHVRSFGGEYFRQDSCCVASLSSTTIAHISRANMKTPQRAVLVSCVEVLNSAQSPGCDDRLLYEALTARGCSYEVLAWQSAEGVVADVKLWSAKFSVALIRTAWDYSNSESTALRFVNWLASLEAAGVRVLNAPAFVRWNSDKSVYLPALAAAGMPVIPTEILRPPTAGAAVPDLQALIAARGWFDGLVIKPAVSAGSRDTLRFKASEGAIAAARAQRFIAAMLTVGVDGESEAPPALTCPAPEPATMLVQPYLSTVEAGGELSVIVIAGRVTHAVVKRPRPGDFRVQEEHGGSHTRVEVAPDAAALALRAVAAAAAAASSPPLLYARVDFLRDAAGALALLEVEAIEPALFFCADAGLPLEALLGGRALPSGAASPAAAALADALAGLLTKGT